MVTELEFASMGDASLKHLPYIVIILLVSRNNRMPLGEETSNCNRWDLSREHRSRKSVRCVAGRLGNLQALKQYLKDLFGMKICRLHILM